jgi:hypothetical protein
VPKLKYQPLADRQQILSRIEKGRRSKWWRRVGSPSRGFRYVDAAGKNLTDESSL